MWTDILRTLGYSQSDLVMKGCEEKKKSNIMPQFLAWQLGGWCEKRLLCGVTAAMS